MKTNFCFLAIGKTSESTETQEFKRYVGVGSSYVLAVNPDKEELEKLYGHEIANAPEYIRQDDDVASIRIDFIVKTDPEQCDGAEVINKASFFLYNAPAYNSDKTKVQIIDKFGNATWATVEDAKMNKKILTRNGNEAKIAPNYRIAYRGEADLVEFLKLYLNIADAFDYKNGSWVLKDNPNDYEFSLEHLKDYFKGDVSELREALALQPKNKIKLLYGVRTTDRGQFQTINTRSGLMLRNSAGMSALTRLANNIANLTTLDTYYEAVPLHEYETKATDLSKPAEVESETTGSESGLPWD